MWVVKTALLTSTNWKTDREQLIRSIALTATPPTLERLAKTRQQDWLNTSGQQGKVMSTIELLTEHHQLTNHTIDWDSVQCLTYSTNYFQQLTLESWCPNSKQTSLNRCDLLLPPYAQLIHNINITNKLNRTTLLYQTIKADLSWPTHATWVLQPITSRQIWPISS